MKTKAEIRAEIERRKAMQPAWHPDGVSRDLAFERKGMIGALEWALTPSETPPLSDEKALARQMRDAYDTAVANSHNPMDHWIAALAVVRQHIEAKVRETSGRVLEREAKGWAEQVVALRAKLDAHKARWLREVRIYKADLAKDDIELASLRSERDALKAERDEAETSAMKWRGEYKGLEIEFVDRVERAREEIATLRAALEKAERAMKPFASFAPRVEQFVNDRVKAANDVSAIMPTRHFRLAHFEDIKAAAANIRAALSFRNIPALETNDVEAVGGKTEAVIKRDGFFIVIEWIRFGTEYKAQIYEPVGLKLSPALADLMALCIEEPNRRAPAKPAALSPTTERTS